MIEKDYQELESFYKKNRLLTHLFPYISQRDNWDCAIACIAMVKDIEYKEARKSFKERPKMGISGYTIAKIIKSPEFIRHPFLINIDNYKNKGNYILLTKFDKSDWGHYIVLDKNNNIYNPEDGIVKLKEYDRKMVSFHIKIG